jgi:hypothetical protein
VCSTRCCPSSTRPHDEYAARADHPDGHPFTAYAMNGDQAQMQEAGCDGYIAKPIEVDTFGG